MRDEEISLNLVALSGDDTAIATLTNSENLKTNAVIVKISLIKSQFCSRLINARPMLQKLEPTPEAK